MNAIYDKDQIKTLITNKLLGDLGIEYEYATVENYYKACALVIKQLMFEKRRNFAAETKANGRKRVYYLCMEFLLGRALKNAIYNLDMVDEFTAALKDFGIDIEEVYVVEPDAGLGNGGLGRLAACYLDALATCDYPAVGYSILYEYGIFKQKIIEGWQTETPDYWLQGWDVWFTPIKEHSVTVYFGGEVEERWEGDHHFITYKNRSNVTAVPYDVYIPGFNSKGVSVLRLWKAQSVGLDMESFNRGDYLGAFGMNSISEAISKVLYPNDNHLEGKTLRLRQQYFLCAASMSDIIRRHIELYGDIDNFPEKNALHINDTHPSLAIPELMRILLDDFGFSWDKAWDYTYRTFAYTNHTVMSEALETWSEDLLKSLLPRIYSIICEINRVFCLELETKYRAEQSAITKMSIISNRSVKMANLSVVGAYNVNGVSKLHSQILKDDLFKEFYNIKPYKFTNVTNGIASRRWLQQANPALTSLLCELLGRDFLTDLNSLSEIMKYAKDKTVLKKLASIKKENKARLGRYIRRHTGVTLNNDSIFDVQVKRLHEYKRQHLNALHIYHQFLTLKENPNMDFVPKTYIFAAKAAPGYYMAKQIIKFICTLRNEIEKEPAIRDKLRIVFLEDYSVSLSELLMPAAEISQQISLAGTEASGTGNMKLMLNGAITLGTLDGANVEIYEAVGDDNILLFGMKAQEVEQIRYSGYNPDELYTHNPIINNTLNSVARGIGDNSFLEIVNSLKYTDSYMVLKDFESYRLIQLEASRRYRDAFNWQSMSLTNIAQSGRFSADRAVREYAQNIWNLD